MTKSGATGETIRVVPEKVVITPPKIGRASFRISGTAPYVQARFSEKAARMMEEKMLKGSQARKGQKREARDFEDDYNQAFHVSEEGWYGIPAGAFRAAMISACRLVNFKMTLAKLSIFVEADGWDKVDSLPLVKIAGTPVQFKMPTRNATGVADIRVRPMWRNWAATVRVSYDADQFSLVDISNLMNRVGLQIGVGEGRPDSRESAGLGWGTFEIVSKDAPKESPN